MADHVVMTIARASPEHDEKYTLRSRLCLAARCLTEKCLTNHNGLDARRDRSTINLRDRFAGIVRPLRRQEIRLSPYSQRRYAVARETPKRQQIAFHGARSARIQTSRA